jgi:sugar phosphate permease
MAAMAVVIFVFKTTTPNAKVLAGGCFIAMGFLVYVPQMLIAAMAMNLGTKRAAAAAVGMTGIFGYASSVLSGWGIGSIADRAGWGAAFWLMIGCAVATLVLMALTWNVGAHPQLERPAFHPKPQGFPLEPAHGGQAATVAPSGAGQT